MKLKKIGTGIFLGILSLGVHAESGSNWQHVNKFNGFIVSVDMLSISNVSEYGNQNNKKFWVKHSVVEDLEQDGLAVGDYRMVLTLANCNNKTSGIKSVTSYIKQKNGLVKNETETLSVVEMEDIIPGTIGAET